ncbi:MAG: NERD domain-containing protein [Actinomycetia bacterium]|nr:NERD domain-containing protein [Actinomycetes bacterium]
MTEPACLCLPERPVFRSKAEEKVWKQLRRSLRAEDVLLHGVHFTGNEGDGEVDLIVLMPEGFATVEVKGGRVWFEDGAWWQAIPSGTAALDLEDQAIGHKHRVGKYLAARWNYGRPRMQHLVALPDVDVGARDPSPGLPRRLIIDRGQLQESAGLIYDSLNVRMQGQPNRRPGPDLVQQAATLLGGRGDPQEQLLRRAEAVEEQVGLLTQEQFQLLDYIQKMPRAEITGGPGTGKTWLAVEQARRWCEAGKRVGFICFSRGLAEWVRRTAQRWPDKQRDLFWAGTFHALGQEWGVEIPDTLSAEDSKFWDVEFVEVMRRLAGMAEPIFDAVLVDEGQDFADDWWQILLNGMKDPDAGNLLVFADERQQVFDRVGTPLAGLPRLTTSRNMRNTRQIAGVFQPLMAESAELVGFDGPPVRFVECSTEAAIQTADDEAVALLDAGWQPRDVALLTTHHRHPVHRELSQDSKERYWTSLWDDDDIFYCTAVGFKGLERPAVVLAVDGFRSGDVAKQVLFVGLSRARHQLVVCGDPDLLRQVGGKELVKRLRRSQ